LEGGVLEKSLLQGMERVILGQLNDCCFGSPLRLANGRTAIEAAGAFSGFCSCRIDPTKRMPLRGSVLNQLLRLTFITDRVPGGIDASLKRPS
jgi:hypothetical protein